MEKVKYHRYLSKIDVWTLSPGCIIGFCRASSRILANMAEDHILTRSFEKPAFCFIFVMIVSILLSLFGRNVLGWVVDLSSFGAIVAFGYASASGAGRRARRYR